MKLKKYKTIKLHYGKYLYKICLKNQLACLFNSTFSEKYRNHNLEKLQINYDAGQPLKLFRWRNAGAPISEKDFDNAKILNKTLKTYDGYRKRVEFGDRIMIYTSSSEMFDYLINNLNDCITETHIPEEGIEHFLTKNIGTAIVKTPPDYDFKVYLKGNKIDPSFGNWLRSNADKCKVGEMTLWNIEHSSYNTSGNYFYIKNEKVLTMVRMIIGHNIRKVERLIYQGDIDK